MLASEHSFAASGELPSAVTDLLWDVDPSEVRLSRHRDFLIGRILSRGTWAAVEWLRRELGDAAIGEYLERTRGRLLSPRQLRFWQLVLELADEDVSGWIADRQDGAKLWDRRWSPCPPLAPLVDWPEYGFGLASLEDLGCMKLAAIAQRGAKKDFFDLHALLRAGHTLPRLLQAFARKYYSNADPAPVLVGLSYFDDADLEPDPVRLTSPAWEIVREEIRQATRSVVGARRQAG